MAREIGNFWRVDLTGLCLTMGLGLFLRLALFKNAFGAILVTLLNEPVTLLIVLALRPLFLHLYPTLRFAWRPVFLAGLLVAIGASAATAWAKFVTTATGWTVPTWTPAQSLLVPFGYYVIILVCWNVARLWVAAERTARLEAERAILASAEALKAELNHLRHQHDPHFLFNALSGIASEITVQPKAAVRMVHELAAYLRYSLDHRDISVSPFSADIDAAGAYLELQKARFGDDLNYRLAADQQARGRMVPTFLLQPLVENAVKHGLKSGTKPVDIAVTAACDGHALRIVVSNTGTLNPDWADGGDPGVGLSVMRRRLALHYPDRHRFDLRQTGATVTAQLQLRGEPCSA